MNDYLKIALILLLVVVLFLLLRAFFPALKKSLRDMPKWLLVVLIAMVAIALVLLIRSMAKSGGALGGEERVTEDSVRREEENVYEDCIIVRADEVFINNAVRDTDAVRAYVRDRKKNHTMITIVDDYGLAGLYHEVVNICKEEGADFETKDETGLTEE